MGFSRLTHQGAFVRLQAEGGLLGIAFRTVLGDVMRRLCRWSLIATGVALVGCATLSAAAKVMNRRTTRASLAFIPAANAGSLRRAVVRAARSTALAPAES